MIFYHWQFRRSSEITKIDNTGGAKEAFLLRKVFIDKLVSLINEEGMDAILVCPSEELKFLIGFSPMMCERFQGLFIKTTAACFIYATCFMQASLNTSFLTSGFSVGLTGKSWLTP